MSDTENEQDVDDLQKKLDPVPEEKPVKEKKPKTPPPAVPVVVAVSVCFCIFYAPVRLLRSIVLIVP